MLKSQPAIWCVAAACVCIVSCAQVVASNTESSKPMQLGAFSISLTVKDIEASKNFYEKFGFKVVGGNIKQKWLVLGNGDHKIGIFQGMFEKNMLTFNPGWDQNKAKLESFTDIRELQRQLKAKGVSLLKEVDEKTSGPASFIAIDPDGNPILVDQHV
jgi:lactoylglutathione lyase